MTFDELNEKLNNGEFDILVIAHNCFNNYRRGIPTQLVQEYPQISQADINSSTTPNSRKLGHYSIAECLSNSGKNFLVLNAYIQYFYGKVNIVCSSNGSTLMDRTPVQYEAIHNVFKLIGRKFNNKKIGVLGFPGVKVETAKVLIEDGLKGTNNILTYINFEEKDKERSNNENS